MSLGFLIAISLGLGIAAWLGFLWSVRSGQYEDPEGPKYGMLDDEEDGHGPQKGHGKKGIEDGPPRR